MYGLVRQKERSKEVRVKVGGNPAYYNRVLRGESPKSIFEDLGKHLRENAT